MKRLIQTQSSIQWLKSLNQIALNLDKEKTQEELFADIIECLQDPLLIQPISLLIQKLTDRGYLESFFKTWNPHSFGYWEQLNQRTVEKIFIFALRKGGDINSSNYVIKL